MTTQTQTPAIELVRATAREDADTQVSILRVGATLYRVTVRDGVLVNPHQAPAEVIQAGVAACEAARTHG